MNSPPAATGRPGTPPSSNDPSRGVSCPPGSPPSPRRGPSLDETPFRRPYSSPGAMTRPPSSKPWRGPRRSSAAKPRPRRSALPRRRSRACPWRPPSASPRRV
eukprot:1956485-Pyramimonas_sp.AAC.1